MPIIQKLIFYKILPNIRPSIRFLNRLFGRVFRLFKFFSFLRKNLPIIAIIPNIRFQKRIFGFKTEYSAEYSDYSKIIFFSKKKHADYCDYSEYSVSKPNIRPSIPIIQNFFFSWKKFAEYCDYSE